MDEAIFDSINRRADETKAEVHNAVEAGAGGKETKETVAVVSLGQVSVLLLRVCAHVKKCNVRPAISYWLLVVVIACPCHRPVFASRPADADGGGALGSSAWTIYL